MKKEHALPDGGNTPIQIYWTFNHQNLKKKIQTKKKNDIFHISA